VTSDTPTQTAEPQDHLILKGGHYYRPNRCGYTASPVEAGRYTKAEAERECRVEPWHMRAVPLSEFRSSPDVSAYAAHLRDMGFTVTAPKDWMA
jgi:hypothetical protein